MNSDSGGGGSAGGSGRPAAVFRGLVSVVPSRRRRGCRQELEDEEDPEEDEDCWKRQKRRLPKLARRAKEEVACLCKVSQRMKNKIVRDKPGQSCDVVEWPQQQQRRGRPRRGRGRRRRHGWCFSWEDWLWRGEEEERTPNVTT